MASDSEDQSRTLQFNYIKGKDFRVIAADGAMGSITPSGRLLLTLYNERAALPRVVVYELKPDGELGETVSMEGRSGFVRDMEVAVSLDRDSAETLRDLLTERLARMDELEEREDK